MVIGHDISVWTDDNAASASLLLTGLGSRERTSEEELEEGVYGLILLAALDRYLYIYDGPDRSLGRIGEIGIVGLCQIDSPVFDLTVLRDGFYRGW